MSTGVSGVEKMVKGVGCGEGKIGKMDFIMKIPVLYGGEMTES